MEILGKIIRGIASIPLVGSFFVLIVGFLPFIALLPFKLSIGVVMIIGGLLTAAWCYLLNAKNIINIVTPVILIPNWVLGIVLAIGGVYGIITNAWDKSGTAPEVFIEDVESSVNAPASISKPEPAPVSIPTPSVQNEAEKAAVMENAKKITRSKQY